jgi:hypothetical protein
MKKPENWHQHDPQMTLKKLIVQESFHIDGRFPMTLSCASIGGDVLLELVRKDEQLLAIFYFSEVGAEQWMQKFGFEFIERGWKVIEGKRGFPYVVGKVGLREDPWTFADEVELAISFLMPEEVRTGCEAIPTYECPHDLMTS